MEDRVLDELGQDLAHDVAAVTGPHRVVQLVHELDEPLVLRVDVAEPDLEHGTPSHQCHDLLPSSRLVQSAVGALGALRGQLEGPKPLRRDHARHHILARGSNMWRRA